MADVTMVSTPPDGSCGIGTYTSNLTKEFPEDVNIESIYIEKDSSNPVEYITGAIKAIYSETDTIHIQHEYGIFGYYSIFSWIFFPIILAMSYIYRKKVIVTMHNAIDPQEATLIKSMLAKVYIPLNNALVDLTSDQLIFLSQNCRKLFNKTTPTNNAEQHTLSHGVKTNGKLDIPQTKAKNKFGYDENTTLIVEPGYIRPKKGYDDLIEVARDMKSTQFLFAGGPPNQHTEYANSLLDSSPDNVEMTGRLDDEEFHTAFIAADVITLPYEEVTQSGVLNLAATYLTPVIGSKEDYFLRLKDRWNCVEVVDFSDTNRAVEMIMDIINNSNRRKTLRENLKAYRESQSMERIAEEHSEIYSL